MGFMNGIYEWDISIGFAIVILVFLHCLILRFAWYISRGWGGVGGLMVVGEGGAVFREGSKATTKRF